MRYLVFARHKFIYDTTNGITLIDLAPETARKDNDVYVVHEQYAPTDQEPVGYVESEQIDTLLGGYKSAAITVTEASEIIAAVEADLAEAV